MKHSEIMQLAIDRARKTMNEGIGGPFGAVITDENGNVICVSNNKVLSSHDPTAHAEISAIREASEILGTHDLSGCIMYATGYPCPMCASAMIWANIKKCYYGATPKDAEKIGFRDDVIYRFMNGEEKSIGFEKEECERQKCVDLFTEYHEKQKEIY